MREKNLTRRSELRGIPLAAGTVKGCPSEKSGMDSCRLAGVEMTRSPNVVYQFESVALAGRLVISPLVIYSVRIRPQAIALILSTMICIVRA